MRLPHIEFRSTFLQTVCLLIGIMGLNGAAWGKTVQWDLAKYRQELQLIQLQAENVQKQSDLPLLEARINAFPDELVVTYPISNDETARQKVSMSWLRDYFTHNRLLYPDDRLAEDPNLINFIALIETRSNEMEALTPFDLDASEVNAKRDNILSERIYNWKAEKEESVDEEEEEEDFEMPEEPAAFEEVMEFIERYGTYIIAVFLGIFILFLLWRVTRNLDLRKKKEVLDIGSGGGLLKEDDPRDSETMRKVASTAKEQQKFNAAVRYYYLALILALHEEEIIRYKSSLTNWEYFRKMKANGFPEAPTRLMTSIFDDTQYGHKQIEEAEFLSFMEQVSAMDEQVERRKPSS